MEKCSKCGEKFESNPARDYTNMCSKCFAQAFVESIVPKEKSKEVLENGE